MTGEERWTAEHFSQANPEGKGQDNVPAVAGGRKRDPLDIVVPLVAVALLASFARSAYDGSEGVALRVVWLSMLVQLLATAIRNHKRLYWCVVAPTYFVGLIATVVWIRR